MNYELHMCGRYELTYVYSILSYFQLVFFNGIYILEGMKKLFVTLWHILSIIIFIATIGLAVVVFAKPHLLLSLINYVGEIVQHLWWRNYLFLWLIGFVESVPFLNMAIPGQTFVIIISGFLAQFDYFGTSMTVVIISTLGDRVAFLLGKYKWASLLTHYWPTFGITDKSLDKIRGILKKMGHRAIFVSKRNSYTRGMLPFIAGIGHMRKWEFLLYNMLWSVVYWFGLVLLAKLFVGNTERVVPYVRWIGVGMMILAVLWYFLIHKRNERKAR
jgi:membrane protein DedA with SNARE-associated domain